MHRILSVLLLTTSLFAREYIAIIDFEGINVSESDAKALTQQRNRIANEGNFSANIVNSPFLFTNTSC